MRLLLNTVNPDKSLAEGGLSVTQRMRQRHEHLLALSMAWETRLKLEAAADRD